MSWQIKTNKHLAYSLILLGLFILQTCGKNLTFSSFFEPDLIFGFIIAVAMWEGEFFGFVYGLAGGALCDIFGGRPGYFALVYMLSGYAVSLIVKYIIMRKGRSYVIICFLAFSAVSLISFFLLHSIWGQGGIKEVFLNVILKRGTQTAAVGTLLYYVTGKLSEKLGAEEI